MINCRCDFDPQPFGKFLVLYAQILDSFLILDLFEKLSEAVAFYNIPTESEKLASFFHISNLNFTHCSI